MFCSHDRAAFFDHVLFQQMHEKIQLMGGTFPVFTGQAVERQLLDRQPRTFFDGPPYAGHPAAMPLDARQITALGPASVAVHDHGNMSWQLLARNVAQRIAGSRR